MEFALRIFKQFLTILGERLPRKYVGRMQGVLNFVLIGRWMREHGFDVSTRVTRREDVWASVASQVRDRQVLYLEFGVYRGDATRYWAGALKNPASILHGFDSFEGLPQEAGPWTGGQFDTGGAMPVVDDPRVRFFKGWFDQVLPTYTVPPHDVLVLNMDADLYSSTRCVFRCLGPYIKPGTFIYFDEINHLAHEARAFDEFMSESGRTFRAVAADKTLTMAAFECVG
jgi:hypothetical protein